MVALIFRTGCDSACGIVPSQKRAQWNRAYVKIRKRPAYIRTRIGLRKVDLVRRGKVKSPESIDGSGRQHEECHGQAAADTPYTDARPGPPPGEAAD